METRIKKKYVLKKKVKKAITKSLLGIILFLIGMILIKNNPSLKKIIKENIYENSFSFKKNKKVVEKYLGSLESLNEEKTSLVSNNTISYESIEKVNNKLKLKVPEKYPVPAIESGVVLYIGEKEELGKVLIIEQIDGVEAIYQNIDFQNMKLYDYIEKNEIIGEAINKEIFLLFQKNGETIDYQDKI